MAKYTVESFVCDYGVCKDGRAYLSAIANAFVRKVASIRNLWYNGVKE